MTLRLTALAALCAVLPALAQTPASDWPSYNRTLTSDRFSPLAEIDTSNVASLREVCSFDTGLTTSFQTGPLVAGGTLYFTSELDTFAIDASDCSLRWRTTIDAEPAGPLQVNRGVALLDGRLFRGFLDGRLVALSAATGDVLWEQQVAIAEKGETIPAAPVAHDGRVFVGNAGGDNYGVKGRIYAFDAATGRPLWETFLVPKEQSVGILSLVDAPVSNDATDGLADTWGTPSGEPISGGATWTSYTLDPDARAAGSAGLLYVPTANPAPDFASGFRGDDANLMTNSVTVLDAATGAYVRHHLLVPEDFHDWDASAAPALVTTAAGRRAVLAGAKDGFLHGFDDTTGDRLFQVSVTTRVNATAPLTTDGTYFCPGALGGVQWNGPAYSPRTNLAYVGSVDWCTTVQLASPDAIASVSLGQPWSASADEDNIFGEQDDPARARGWLNAVDADSGTIRWVWQAPTPLLSGVTATAGDLVFVGDLTGHLRAFDARTGQQRLDYAVGGPIGGGVVTYRAAGRQLVAVAAGMTAPVWAPWQGGPARIVVLGLPE